MELLAQGDDWKIHYIAHSVVHPGGDQARFGACLRHFWRESAAEELMDVLERVLVVEIVAQSILNPLF